MVLSENSISDENTKQSCLRVELILWAKGLANLDKFSKSDPLCVVEQLEEHSVGPEWAELGRTEPIMNNLDPKWNKKIHLDYWPEKKQELRFSCYDIDSDKDALTFHDFLGRTQCTLAQILAAPNGTLSMRLKKDTGAFVKGEFFVHAEQVQLEDGNEPMVLFEVRGLFSSPAQKLHHAIVGNAGARTIKPTPPSAYLEFYRLAQTSENEENLSENILMVHRTEKVKCNWYPIWQQFGVPLRLLSYGNQNSPFLINCYDKEMVESQRLIGSIQTSVHDLTVDHQWRVELVAKDEVGKNGRRQRDVHKKQGHLHFIHVRVT